ncbi:hypothetical protein SDC9_60140 [bioreactor metagenome]|uniref:Uncharacterized protein n=1 Tax=bioreactor metagenome TaxID=1076179 RepID=A0A644XDG2_9ZZZZ
MLVGRHDLVLDRTPAGDPVGLRQVVHREVDTIELAPGGRQIPRPGRAHRHHDGVVARLQLGPGDVGADGDTGAEQRALVLHLPDPAVEDRLLHLELRDAVPQQATGDVGPLEHRHGVTDPGQLLGDREARGPRADHRDGVAGVPVGCLRLDVAILPGALGDGDLDALDRDRVAVDADHAGRLARCRAQPPGELREVVGRVQPVGRGLPVVAPDQVVPLRDDVAERAAVVAERDAAVHAAGRLGRDDRQERGGGAARVDLVPVLHPFLDVPTRRVFAGELHETTGISHGSPPSSWRWSLRRRGPRPRPGPGPPGPGRSHGAAPW